MLISEVESRIASLLGTRVEARYNSGRTAVHGDIGFAFHALDSSLLDRHTSETIKDALADLPYVADVHYVGKFLNIRLNRADYVEALRASTVLDIDQAGMRGMPVLLEHTSINPNAAPHVGRSRNAILGDTIARTLRALGAELTSHYYVNDFGRQIALLLVALGPDGVHSVDFADILDVYVRINAQAKDDPAIGEQALSLLAKAEAGDTATLDALREIARHSLQGQLAILNQLGITFDDFDFETDLLNSAELGEIEEHLSEKNLTHKDEHGRVVIDLTSLGFDREEGRYLVLRRANGSSMYVLRDLAYNLRKARAANEGRNIVVLGEDHKLYMEQLDLVIGSLGEQTPESVFYSYVALKDGKMSTRQGSVVLLSEFIDQARQLARERVANANPNLETVEIDGIAEDVATAAVRFALLRNSPSSTITFDLADAVRFEGATGPYLQYTAVRCASIREKASGVERRAITEDVSDAMWDVTLVADQYERAFLESAARLQPNVVCDYLTRLSKAFNKLYASEKVITDNAADDRLLFLVERVHAILEHGLGVLGIKVPDRM
ncbi:arginine--tRNA ligase [Lipingzhangella sp. LS1_29]|uniref:Arginine--tRNA ligase n=1 Tax=Lipingzhangella rawalii TaxID=2055835 RepID=A0ABU2H1B3_9ACTN|nr:arginine--tRNA ligase [Lipingzhangella rawalii]MDS1269098.1 arginine--tRNA ligase [Lipingzhangella rawalii]